jgi:hypothetical protein
VRGKHDYILFGYWVNLFQNDLGDPYFALTVLPAHLSAGFAPFKLNLWRGKFMRSVLLIAALAGVSGIARTAPLFRMSVGHRLREGP